MKLLFTDIDGVLNPGWTKTWKKSCITAYNRIVSETGVVCVVTSTWRVNRQSVYQLQNLFLQQGVDVEVVGYTPILNDHRGLEIASYLEENPCSEYVIVDDNMKGISDGFYDLKNFVQPVGYVGLTEREADICINLLNFS